MSRWGTIFGAMCICCGGAAKEPQSTTTTVETRTSETVTVTGTEGAGKTVGTLPREVIQQVVRANFADMKKCYEEGLGRNTNLKGRITTKFVIETDGSVSRADEIHAAPRSASSSESSEPLFADPQVVSCVVAKFRTLKFPQPDGGKVTVVYPLVFNPGD